MRILLLQKTMVSVFDHKNCLFLSFLFGIIFFAQATPHIVMLMGPSNSGKSCLCKELSQYKDWHKIEKDTIYYREFPKFLARIFPESYLKIGKVIEERDILHAVMKKQCCFKDDATDNEKREALTVINNMQFRLDHGQDSKKLSKEFHNHLTEVIFDEIDAAIHREENIITGVWGIKNFSALLRKKYSEKPIIKVLLHNPIARSYTFFQKRNQIAQNTNNLRELRFWRTWLKTNDMFYVFSHEKKANYLSFISRHELEKIFNVIRKQIVQKREDRRKNLFSSGEMDLLDLEYYEQTWLGDQKNSTNIFLYAKEKYDLIVFNNDNPAILALKIKEYIKKR